MQDRSEYLKQYEPIFDEWYIGKKIGNGRYSEVYEINRKESDRIYKAALKAITIPIDEDERQNVIEANGLSDESANGYFKNIVDEYYNEIKLMTKLNDSSHIVRYEDYSIIEHSDGRGWDILVRMELLTPLNEYVRNHNMTEKDIIHMGRNICNALITCEHNNIIHRDIKPENIFVTNSGKFKLGDFGSARIIGKTTGASTKIGAYDYMAPEVYKEEGSYDNSVDMYSLGVVMYKLLNDNRLPFLPPVPNAILFSDHEKARKQRLNGDRFPDPVNGSKSVSNIILKACSYKKIERFSSPGKMRDALKSVENGEVWPSQKKPIQRTPKEPPKTGESLIDRLPIPKEIISLEEPEKMDNEKQKDRLKPDNLHGIGFYVLCIFITIAIAAIVAMGYMLYETFTEQDELVESETQYTNEELPSKLNSKAVEIVDNNISDPVPTEIVEQKEESISVEEIENIQVNSSELTRFYGKEIGEVLSAFPDIKKEKLDDTYEYYLDDETGIDGGRLAGPFFITDSAGIVVEIKYGGVKYSIEGIENNMDFKEASSTVKNGGWSFLSGAWCMG